MHVFKYLSILLGVSGSLLTEALAETPEIAALKKLQGQVQQVVTQVQPATVALTSNNTGSWGSGVLVSEDGLILTAGHVVQGARDMKVILPDGTEKSADVLGANYTKDTAMLKMREKGSYPFVEMGKSDDLKVGDYLIALGHAGGFDPLRRPPVRFGRMVSRNVGGFFSSDCTLIGGDSGGPIFDIHGKLVGINSSIGRDLKANNHAGISGLVADWEKLKAGRVWGSLSSNPLANHDSPILGAEILGDTNQGVMLGRLIPNGPAHRAGVKPRDVVITIAGVRVNNSRDFVIEINKHRPGKTVDVELLRAGKTVRSSITLGRRGDMYQQ